MSGADAGARAKRVTAFAPGRVNLIGEHTDYNQGLALPFAISEGVTVLGSALDSRRIEAVAIDLGEEDAFEPDQPGPTKGWRAFVRGAVAELQRAGIHVTGARLEITGNLARGGGLSSSAALEVALTIALMALGDAAEHDRIELARICSRVENEWVGAQTGLLDQLASLLGEREHALRIDFRSLAVERVPLQLGEWKLAIVDSGEQHANAASGYNERRSECSKACRLLGIDSLREATFEMASELPAPLAARARHVVSENERVEDAVRAIADADMQRLGQLLDASHASLRDCYEVSTAAVEDAVDRLHRAGAAGARIMGGGFGGSVLGLMPPQAPLPAEAIEVRPGPGARLVS